MPSGLTRLLPLLLIFKEGHSRLTRIVSTVIHGPFETVTPAGRSNERVRRLVMTVASGILSRLLAALVPLLTLGLSIEYLGKETYGLWMTITALFSLFMFADFGLGSGLLTTLSHAYGRKDIEESRMLISSTFFLLILLALVILSMFALIFPFVPWARLLNAQTADAANLSAILVAVVFVPQVVQLPFAMIQNTQLALQEGYRTNLWQSGASLISLITIIVITKCRLGVIPLVLSVSLIPAIAFFLNWCSFFLISQNQLCPQLAARNRAVSLSLIHTGGAFCFVAVLTTLGLAVDNFIVAHVCGLEEVATFSVVSRVASLLTVTLRMICMPMWAANGEALARGDLDWVRTNAHRTAIFTASLVLVGGLMMLVMAPSAFKLWLGDHFEVSRGLLLGFVGRELVLSIAAPYFMILNAAGKINIQMLMFGLYTPIALISKVLVAQRFGSAGVVWTMVIVYGLLVLPWTYLQATSICASRGSLRVA